MKTEVDITFPLPVRFSCLENCGMCCSYKVALNREEAERIEKVGRDGFLREEACFEQGREACFLKKRDGYCTFLDEKARCGVYSVRPSQCRSYPFYPEPGQIDIDLSCPGVGQGEKVDRALWRELEKAAAGFEGAGLPLPELSFPEDVSSIFPRLQSHPPLLRGVGGISSASEEAERQIVDEFFLIRDSAGTHVRDGRVNTYRFSMDEKFLEIGDNKAYPIRVLGDFPEFEQSEEEIVLSYLSVWLKRRIFRDYVSVSALVAHLSHEDILLSLFTQLIKILFALEHVLSFHWNDDSPRAAFLSEGIRLLDGRLRENCKKVNVGLNV